MTCYTIYDLHQLCFDGNIQACREVMSRVNVMVLEGLEKRFVDQAMALAASNNHIDVVHYLVNIGVRYFYESLYEAVSNGHVDMTELLFSLHRFQQDEYDSELVHASKMGHIEIVRQLLSNGASSYSESIKEARENDHRDIVELLES